MFPSKRNKEKKMNATEERQEECCNSALCLCSGISTGTCKEGVAFDTPTTSRYILQVSRFGDGNLWAPLIKSISVK